MRLAVGTRRDRSSENVIPMINVVFLLLVFFLMTARIAPPLPVEIESPVAAGKPFEPGSDVLIIDADGTPYFKGRTGAEAWDALATGTATDVLELRIDRHAPGALLAQSLARINAATDATVSLVVED